MLFRLLLCALLAGCLASRPVAKEDWSARAAEMLRARIRGGQVHIAGEVLAADAALSRFYLKRGDRPAWVGPGGPLAQADALLGALERTREDGLRPQDYGLEPLRAAMSGWRSGGGGRGAELVELDLLLTAAFLRCAADLQRGRVDPLEIHPEWLARPQRSDLAGLLQGGLDLHQVERTLYGLGPPQEGYARLRQALSRYRRIAAAGGWKQVGERGEGLRARLESEGDLGEGEPLEGGLRRYQRRHGLQASGRLDPETLAALAVPAEVRIAQIELNMERWRWLPHDRSSRYVLVRIADFELEAVEAGKVALHMRVIVGKPYWRTPVFSASMTHLVFNPRWYIPLSIASEEVLPRIRQDRQYLEQRQIMVVSGEGPRARRVSPDSVDWAGDFPYRLVQAAGPENPLGRVKFLMPNPFDVYLHDTPGRALFEREVRDFSHGCIRLEKSLELAAWALARSTDEVRPELEKGADYHVLLQTPLPVYLLYWTAWVDEQGGVHFRNDIYQDDQRLQVALGRD